MKAQGASGEYQIKKTMLNRKIVVSKMYVYSVFKLNRQLVLGRYIILQTTEATDLGL
jgi:hypothetical protein